MLAFRTRPGCSGRLVNSCVIAACCVGAAAVSFADQPTKVVPKKGPTLKAQATKDWKIEIVPGPAIGPSPVPKVERAARQAAEEAAKPATGESEGVVVAGAESSLPAGITPAAYSEVYQSIPFRRSEYAANPSYRHEATIEILLGQIRPKTVVNTPAPTATCCQPAATSLVGVFNPWGAKNFYYHYSYSRPSAYWVW